MPAKRQVSKKAKSAKKSVDEADDKMCFVISPIGKQGTENYEKFKDVLEYLIKPAFRNSGHKMRVIRADDIDRAGSFIKDILESLYSSFIVVADLTDQNPNVFYELGVRHVLSSRTILIAQSIDDIPSDLREYRTIVYDNSAKGAAQFAKRIENYLQEIRKDPERPDNPVLDRIGAITENRIALLEREKEELKNQMSTVLKKGPRPQKKASVSNIGNRIQRIEEIKNAEQQILGGFFNRGEEEYKLPSTQGNFSLYFLMREDRTIVEKWYMSVHRVEFDLEEELADVRVLMDKCIHQGATACKFIIATEEDLSGKRKKINDLFKTMKTKLEASHRKLYQLEIWDESGLLKVEKDLGLKVDL